LAVELTAPQAGEAADSVWALILAAADRTAELEQHGAPQTFTEDEQKRLIAVAPDDPRVVLSWETRTQWRSHMLPSDPRRGLLELYLPICSASTRRPITVGHLGQSLDGFIATRSGDSQFVTGDDNMIHMHRLRALCDAILVGAGTVATDDPQLTTRRVSGPNPIRVVVDAHRRLSSTARVFVDGAAPTLYFCSRSQVQAGETRLGNAEVIGVDATEDGGANFEQVIEHLRARGCARVFVEGGGVTMSALLAANLLDRLQITVAPMLIGDGRPAIRLAPPHRLRDCRRPSCRVFTMGRDVLFDCDLRAEPADTSGPGAPIVHVL
jgi:riboflavin-specific deaminase-like protein